MDPIYMQQNDLSSYTVLAVDDIPLNILLIQKMLSKFNFKLITANNGEKALESIAQNKPDLILLDLMMPGIDGFEVLRRVRANPETAEIKVVILSALNSNEDIVKGFEAGANDFITKPIIMERLHSCIVNQFKIIEASRK